MRALLLLSVGLLGSAGLLHDLPAQEEAQQKPAVQGSESCAACHSFAPGASAMRDRAGRSVAPFDLWQSSMMANSARDPLWRAVVSAEVAATPSRARDIEAKCLRCHTPMADRLGLDDHGTGSLLHVLDCDSELGELARDGVSCTICHGILPEGLGTEASFSGHFELDPERRLFGPHSDPFTMPMRRRTGFTPARGDHILRSELCATCHTLTTETLDPEGRPTGHTLLEQGPYLEWRNSSFVGERSCQDCHVPKVDLEGEAIRTRIARNPGGRDFPPTGPRDTYGRHVFVGGNTLVPALLRDHAEELGAKAPPGAFDATLEATRTQLTTRTARVTIEAPRREGDDLVFEVGVVNLTGHKLPSAHPTRRAWLRVVVRDGEDRVVFASGEHDARGRILGSTGAPLPSEEAGGPIPPHRDRIDHPDEVALYRAVMADAQGRPTFTLLRGATWLVDDRLLPRGWDPEHPEADRTAPAGLGEDTDFVGGSDTVTYRVEGAPRGALSLEATLLYQTLGARQAAELFRWDTPEVEAFRRMFEAADPTPVALDTTRHRVER